MASIVTGATRAAHSAAATVLSAAQIQTGEQIHTKPLKEDDPVKRVTLDLAGKNIIVGIPGAFTPACSTQVPQYIEDYDKYKAKGVNDIYVVSINDVYVMKAWKKNLAPGGTGVRFIADDRGEFVGSLGLVYDATDHLGGPRAKRFVVVSQDSKVSFIAVEEDASKSTVTESGKVLALL